MANRDMIVIGASAGGIGPLREIISSLPGDLPASILIAVHITPHARSLLPDLLRRWGQLEVMHCASESPVELSRVCVAPPDRHLVLRDAKVVLGRGPKENNSRPSVDALFRSAAVWYGPRVIGVVLSGNLDDGTAGLQNIKQRGGLAIVQDPEEAAFVGMPTSAAARVQCDHIASAAEIGALLSKLAGSPAPDPCPEPPPAGMVLETKIAESTMNVQEPSQVHLHGGQPSSYACPECGGSLWEYKDGELTRFRCRVGHAYSSGTLLAEQAQGIEAALWSALRALEENESLSRKLAERFPGSPRTADIFTRRADQAQAHAERIREVLFKSTMSDIPPDPGPGPAVKSGDDSGGSPRASGPQGRKNQV